MTLLLHSLFLFLLLPVLYQAVIRHSKPNNISPSCLCPLWVTLSIWVYLQMQFFPGCCKNNSMLLAWSCFYIHFHVWPPTPSVSERMNQNFNEVRKCIAIEGDFEGIPQRHLGYLKPISCYFTIDLHILRPSQPPKLTYCANILVITAAWWFEVPFVPWNSLILFGTSLRVWLCMVTSYIHVLCKIHARLLTEIMVHSQTQYSVLYWTPGSRIILGARSK